MSLVTPEQAKNHLRAGDGEDADIALKLAAAECAALEYLGCNVYGDQAALGAAIAAAPAALAAATAAFEAAVEAAAAIESAVERDMARFAAQEAYSKARLSAKRTYQGIVANDAIRAAILLILGHLYENREDVVVGASVVELSSGAKALLRPYRVWSL